MSEVEFRNRRGKLMSVSEDIPSEVPENEVKRPPVRRQRRKTRLKKKVILVAAVSLVLLALIPVMLGEYVKSRYAGEVVNAKRAVAEILAKAINYDQDAAILSDRLKSDVAELSTVRDTLCGGGFLDNLASVYPRSKAAFDECNIYKSQVSGLTEKVSEAAEQVRYLEDLQFVLESVTKPLEDRFAVLSSQQENWKNIVAGLKRLAVPTSFGGAHNNLVQKTEAVRDAWIALSQASNAFDGVGFTDSRAKLASAYEDFRAVSVTFSQIVSTNQLEIIKISQDLK